MKPKGKLLIIGGAEDRGENEFLDRAGTHFKRYEILSELLKQSKNKHIEIILAASRVQEDVRRDYERAFERINYPNPGFITIEYPSDAKKSEYLNRIKDSGAVFFTGGDQVRLIELLGTSPILPLIKEKYLHEKDFLIAGTSAGAMALSSIMILGGGKEEALYNKDLELGNGFGFLDNCVIDTHFIKRGRFARLAHAVIIYPEMLGIGLGEDTALIIHNGSKAECRGSGMVIIIDGEHISQTNIKTVQEDEPVFVDNLKVHLLVRNCSFSLKTKRLLPAQNEKIKEVEALEKKDTDVS